MRERAVLVGAQLSVGCGPGAGTEVLLRLTPERT
jgi:nitrate/nitrite-specific signal transduction histidine kinase